MLANIVAISVGIMVGYLGTTVLGFCIVLNKKFMTKFTKYYMRLIQEVMEELDEDLREEV